MNGNVEYFEYKIRAGDTLSRIIFNMFGYGMNDSRYSESEDHILTLNPHITNPNLIKSGDVLRLGVLPPSAKPAIQTKSVSSPITKPEFKKNKTKVEKSEKKTEPIIELVSPQDIESFWALAWLEQNSNYLTIPGGIASGASGNLLSPANVSLINAVSDHYADYKSGGISKGQYDYRRKLSLDKLKMNIGPFEKWIFGKHTTHESIRIARSGGIPATANITRNVNKLNRLATLSKTGGIALVGVGLTASCMQIANTKSIHEKNEIFIETIASTLTGVATGFAVGLFLISNPIGWGTAIVLAVGSTALSYGAGKGAGYTYDISGTKIDFVSGSGVGNICR